MEQQNNEKLSDKAFACFALSLTFRSGNFRVGLQGRRGTEYGLKSQKAYDDYVRKDFERKDLAASCAT